MGAASVLQKHTISHLWDSSSQPARSARGPVNTARELGGAILRSKRHDPFDSTTKSGARAVLECYRERA